MNDKSFTIFFLSNMMEEKGVWALVDACSILCSQGFMFECHFVGRWSDISEETFKRRINQLKLSNHVFAHGAKYGSEKENYWEKADLFVFPTYYHNECFPLVLLEAMQHGVPCISTNEGGIQSIIDDGKTGYIIEKKNSAELAKYIAFLIENPGICKQMGNAGRKKFEEQFLLSRFENNLSQIFQQIINESR
jgi:glycosyltransferase involved in cell wall biosynthesis